MSKTVTRIATDSKAVVLYQGQTLRGRQELVARTAQGAEMFRCRRVKAMAKWLKDKGLKFYEYSVLPRSTREALDNLRAADRQEARRQDAGNQWSRPTLGDVWPKVH